jgi:hypothetical protein
VDVIEWIRSLYELLFLLSLPLLFVGWVLSVLARAGAFMPVLGLLGFADRRKQAVLVEHPEVCAQCLYPVAEAERCPECGATYEEPGAVLSRGDEVARVPSWLRVVTVAPVVLIAAVILLQFGAVLGNKLYWGTYEVEHRHTSAEYVPQTGPGSPGYELQINASLVVDADPNAPQSTQPIDGYMYVVLNNVAPRPSTTVRIDVRDQSWEMLVYPTPIGSAPPSVLTGSGLDGAVDATFREAQLDAFWQDSAAEVDDARRFAQHVLDGKYDELEATSGLATTGSGLQFSTGHRSRLPMRQYAYSVYNSYSIYNSAPGNWISLTLTGLAASFPPVALVGYVVWRLAIRRRLNR